MNPAHTNMLSNIHLAVQILGIYLFTKLFSNGSKDHRRDQGIPLLTLGNLQSVEILLVNLILNW